MIAAFDVSSAPVSETDKFRRNAIDRLAAFLPRAMEDGVLDDTERRELMGILGSGVLSKADVQAAFRDFLNGLHLEVAADGVITDDEKVRVRTVVNALRIPAAFLPPEIAEIVSGN